MSFQQRNTVVSLVIATLILLYFSVRVLLMVQSGTFIEQNVFRLWVVVIIAVIAMNIVGAILANIGHSILYAVRTREEPEKQEFLEDERDELIQLQGTRMTHSISSLGTAAAMLTFALKQPPLVMFCLLIASALVATIVGDIYRLIRYQRGF